LPKRRPVITPRRTSRAASSPPRGSARSASAWSLTRAPRSSTRANAAAPRRGLILGAGARESACGLKPRGRGRRLGARAPSAAVA
jgi:hypothetical protein